MLQWVAALLSAKGTFLRFCTGCVFPVMTQSLSDFLAALTTELGVKAGCLIPMMLKRLFGRFVAIGARRRLGTTASLPRRHSSAVQTKSSRYCGIELHSGISMPSINLMGFIFNSPFCLSIFVPKQSMSFVVRGHVILGDDGLRKTFKKLSNYAGKRNLCNINLYWNFY